MSSATTVVCGHLITVWHTVSDMFCSNNLTCMAFAPIEQLVYTVTYVNVTQVHPIQQLYQFGVPVFKSDCICDCPGGKKLCTAGPWGNSLVARTGACHAHASGDNLGNCMQYCMPRAVKGGLHALWLGKMMPESMLVLSSVTSTSTL